jgi:Pyruvate/2-oxoacid:ferredoxin oxidoreductase gamma subunit
MDQRRGQLQQEHAVLLTGIGGQGVQLAAHVLGRAAIAGGLDVQLFGSYEGMMRGGSTQATVVLAQDSVESPPTVHEADAAVVMHHEHSADVISRVVPGGIILVNVPVDGGTDVTGADGGNDGPRAIPHRPDCTVVDVPAADIAIDLGHVMGASMVMTGVLASATGLVTEDHLARAVEASLPSYRRAHVERNVTALHAGFEWATAHPIATDPTTPATP